MRTVLIPAALALCWVLAPPHAAARSVQAGPDDVVELRAKLRFATTVVLPADEQILDWVCGDAEYWSVQGAANLAFVKPTAAGIETNITLVTDKGHVYTLHAKEVGDDGKAPDLKLFLSPISADPEGSRLRPPRFEPAGAAAESAQEADRARREAREALERARLDALERVEAFRSAYPLSLRFDYRLAKGAADPPFRVAAMWRDDRFTYIRADPEEAAALYETRDGRPSMVPFDFADGLYVTRRHLADGWLQIGKSRLRFWRNEP